MDEVRGSIGGFYKQYIGSNEDGDDDEDYYAPAAGRHAQKGAEYSMPDDECFELPDLPIEIGEIDLQTVGADLGVKYFLVSYSTLNSSSRCSMIPLEGIRKVQREGCGMSSSMYFDTNGSMSEMYIVPDPRTLIVLPWKPEYAWLSSNLYMDGKPFGQCPRTALLKVIHRAARLGYRLVSGVEPEFLLLDKNGVSFGDADDARQPMSLQDCHSTMRQSDTLAHICDCMRTIGWNPYEIDHEGSCCQYEINYDHVTSLHTADRYGFMKFMIKEIAVIHGLRANFMPKAFKELICGSGLHINVSLEQSSTHKNLFRSNVIDPLVPKPLRITPEAEYFIGGLVKRTKESCAVLCPLVNSYKRLNAASYCPNKICWGGNNRTVLIRVPENNRVEHRVADAGTNLYLAQALIFSAGLDGIQYKIDPGEPIIGEVEKHPDILNIPSTPTDLRESLEIFDQSDFVKKALGEPLARAFSKLKWTEWRTYTSLITKWEQDYYSNC